MAYLAVLPVQCRPIAQGQPNDNCLMSQAMPVPQVVSHRCEHFTRSRVGSLDRDSCHSIHSMRNETWQGCLIFRCAPIIPLYGITCKFAIAYCGIFEKSLRFLAAFCAASLVCLLCIYPGRLTQAYARALRVWDNGTMTASEPAGCILVLVWLDDG